MLSFLFRSECSYEMGEAAYNMKQHESTAMMTNERMITIFKPGRKRNDIEKSQGKMDLDPDTGHSRDGISLREER